MKRSSLSVVCTADGVTYLRPKPVGFTFPTQLHKLVIFVPERHHNLVIFAPTQYLTVSVTNETNSSSQRSVRIQIWTHVIIFTPGSRQFVTGYERKLAREFTVTSNFNCPRLLELMLAVQVEIARCACQTSQTSWLTNNLTFPNNNSLISQQTPKIQL